MAEFKPSNICKALTTASLISLTLALVDAILSGYYNPTSLYVGILDDLSVFYWLGFSISLCLFVFLVVSPPDGLIYHYVAIVLLFTYYFIFPIVNLELAPLATSYYPYSEAENLLSTGSFNAPSSYPVTSYRAWPFMHILNASILSLGGLTTFGGVQVSIFLPPFLLLFATLFLFCSMNRKMKSENAIMLCMVIFSSLFAFQLSMVPQSLAYTFFLYMVSIILLIGVNNRAWAAVFIILALGVIGTHFLTAVVVVAGFTLVIIGIDRRYMQLGLFLIGLILIWMTVVSPNLLLWAFSHLINQLGSINPSVIETKAQITSMFRGVMMGLIAAYFGTLLIITLWTFIINCRRRNLSVLTRPLLFSLAIMPLALFRYALNASESGTEMFDRIFLFGIPVLAIYIFSTPLTHSLRNRKPKLYLSSVISVMVVIMLISSLVVRSPSSSFNQVNPSDLIGASFLSESMNKNDTFTMRSPQLIWYFKGPLDYNKLGSIGPRYTVISESKILEDLFNYGYVRGDMFEESNIYNNGNIHIYSGVSR